jgi:hypothetical protein
MRSVLTLSALRLRRPNSVTSGMWRKLKLGK